MRQSSRWLSALVLLLASAPGLTQDHIPKVIDVHIHYDGEPGILEKLLVKLDGADGLAFLLTTPAGFPQASKLIQEHPDRFIGFGDIKLDDPKVLQEIDRFQEAGFRGLGEITSALKAYDDRALLAYLRSGQQVSYDSAFSYRHRESNAPGTTRGYQL
jgi:hypothetical protein